MQRRPPLSLLLIVAACCATACHRAESPDAAKAATAPVTQHPPPPATATDVAPPAGVLRAYAWHCDDGRNFVMRNLWRERAISIPMHDGSHRLDQTRAASGARYASSGESTVFWIKGGTATLEHKGEPTVRCLERREESMREDSRLGGRGTPPPQERRNTS
jgi:membrane-bound inhibitor of C-type lysozyme